MNERIFFIPGIKMHSHLYKGWEKALAELKNDHSYKIFKKTYFYMQHKKVLSLRDEILQALKDDIPTVLVGHSFGGIIAVAVAAEARKQGMGNVTGVVTLASPHKVKIAGVKEAKDELGYENSLDIPVYSFGGTLDAVVPCKLTSFSDSRHVNLAATHKTFLYPNIFPANEIWEAILGEQEQLTSSWFRSTIKALWPKKKQKGTEPRLY